MKCKHKNTEDRNTEIGGYNIPDGCITEYDIYCKDCGHYLGHWAYGYPDYDYWYNCEATKIDKIKEHIKNLKLRIKNKIYFKKNDKNLPF